VLPEAITEPLARPVRCRHHAHNGYGDVEVQEIELRDAKSRLSAVIDQARQGEASIITRHGRPEAVVLSFEEWQRLSRVPSFGRLLMATPLTPGDLPARQNGLRDIEF
jgi:antitoxin Phd